MARKRRRIRERTRMRMARKRRRTRKNTDDEADEDCKDGMIEDPLKKLAVHFYKLARMTKKRCRSACKKKKKCKAFDYNHNECRGVSKIGNPRFGENKDERKFC